MRKRILVLLLACSVFMVGCASKTNTVDLTQSAEQKFESTEIVQGEQNSDILSDEDVDIVLSVYSFDDAVTINDYIEDLQKSNPDEVYSVYDDSHYIHTLKESERKEMVEEFKHEEYINNTFQEIFSDEQYGGAFVSMEYDEMFRNIKFYADKTAYDSAGIVAVLGPVFIGSIYGDIVQAYNLVPVDERSVTIQIIDDSTGEVIYDSSKEE